MRLENRMRELRTERGWSQQELARTVEVSRQTIHAIEKGGYEPSVRLALELANALERSLDDVFWLEDTKRGEA